MSDEVKLDIHAILNQIPHRYPFLLIDRVTSCKPGVSVTAVKNVSINEPFFTGHFPNRPVMPGVLIIEAMAQAAGILAFLTNESAPSDDTLYVFAGIDKARFKRQVEPGDQLHIDVKLIKRRSSLWKFSASATVDGKVVCSAKCKGWCLFYNWTECNYWG